MLACENSRHKVIEFLLSKGAKLENKNSVRRTFAINGRLLHFTYSN
jgi:hypothetical protein